MKPNPVGPSLNDDACDLDLGDVLLLRDCVEQLSARGQLADERHLVPRVVHVDQPGWRLEGGREGLGGQAGSQPREGSAQIQSVRQAVSQGKEAPEFNQLNQGAIQPRSHHQASR